jgi:FtsZ-binding cell division protein ZapB
LADERSLGSEFVQNVFRVIHRHSDAFPAVDAEIRNKATQIADLQAEVAELTTKNKNLVEENDKLSKEVSDLGNAHSEFEKEHTEVQAALSNFDHIL